MLGLDLQDRLQVPTTVDSDVNLITLAEQWFGHGRGLSDFLVVSVEHTIGLGIVHAGELFRGANGLSPDLGDLIVSPDGSDRERSSPSGTPLGDRLDDRDPGCSRRSPSRDTPREAACAGRAAMEHARLELAHAGDARTAKIFDEAGRALGLAIANLITLFAPPKVILAGSALQAGHLLLEPIRSAVQAATPETIADVAEIVVHDSGDGTWARGAAALMLRDLYGAPWRHDRTGQEDADG